MPAFPLQSGILAEDFLCVPEPNEDECVPSGLDGDETAHKQVSKNGPYTHIGSAVPRLKGICMQE